MNQADAGHTLIRASWGFAGRSARLSFGRFGIRVRRLNICLYIGSRIGRRRLAHFHRCIGLLRWSGRMHSKTSRRIMPAPRSRVFLPICFSWPHLSNRHRQHECAYKFSAWLLASAVPNVARCACRKPLKVRSLQEYPTAIWMSYSVELADLNQTGGFRPQTGETRGQRAFMSSAYMR
jgi:hypothetical protein